MTELEEKCKEVDVPSEWYEQEIKRLHIENEKLKKLVDILLEREMKNHINLDKGGEENERSK